MIGIVWYVWACACVHVCVLVKHWSTMQSNVTGAVGGLNEFSGHGQATWLLIDCIILIIRLGQ